MKSYRYVILGAGPSGLSFAHSLKELGETSFVVIEKEEEPGGLCRSEEVDGAPLDIGGGHFLDVKRQEVLNLLFRFLPRSEWQEYPRISTIRIRNREIDYPFESNLWQLPVSDQLDFLESIAQAGSVRGEPMPEAFEEWITWKLGKLIATEYMLPYNKKIWSMDLNRLGTYWLHKLPDVSFRDTLLSCLEGQAHGLLPGHGTFLYPRKYGYGEVWKRMGDALGDRLLIGTPVSSIDVSSNVVNGRYKADTIITTIPWTMWPGLADLPSSVTEDISQLHYSSIDIDYRPKTLATESHWVYDPDESLAHHRTICRANLVAGSNGHWLETNSKRSGPADNWRHHNEFAYPLNTLEKPDALARVLRWSRQQSIIGLGRWGTWEHMNSDVAVSQAIAEAKTLLGGEGLE
jgi:protoporphyrinogen oxidase